jgi:anti-sigma factor RsiW
MSCSPFDLRDYLFGELAEDQRRQVDSHARSCSRCHEEIERLRIMHSTLLVLRDEEVPQRIGFVSDKVFEPSLVRRAWQVFWGSSARLGFASAVVLSSALVVFGFLQQRTSTPVVNPAAVDTARLEAAMAPRIAAAVEKAVAESESRQARKTNELLAAAELRYNEQRRATERVAEEVSYLQKRYNVMLIASNEMGGAK